MIELNDKAHNHILQLMVESGITPETHNLRVGVKGGGCSGFTYGFTWDWEKNEDDFEFPINDKLQVLIDAGVKAVVQPGGSARDSEVIDVAKKAGITMYFTGTRHFSHN